MSVEQMKPRKAPTEIVAVDYETLIAHDLASLMDLIEGRAFEVKKQGILTPIVLYEGKSSTAETAIVLPKPLATSSSAQTSKHSKAISPQLRRSSFL
jgi:hypothetical protein